MATPSASRPSSTRTPSGWGSRPTTLPVNRGPSSGADPAAVRAAWEAAYADEAFVHLLAPGVWPRTADVIGSIYGQLGIPADAPLPHPLGTLTHVVPDKSENVPSGTLWEAQFFRLP